MCSKIRPLVHEAPPARRITILCSRVIVFENDNIYNRKECLIQAKNIVYHYGGKRNEEIQKNVNSTASLHAGEHAGHAGFSQGSSAEQEKHYLECR